MIGCELMRGRLKKLYPQVTEEYIQKAVDYINESELLQAHSDKLEKITDEELKEYYEKIIFGL